MKTKLNKLQHYLRINRNADIAAGLYFENFPAGLQSKPTFENLL